jgi:hypothetical protein
MSMAHLVFKDKASYLLQKESHSTCHVTENNFPYLAFKTEVLYSSEESWENKAEFFYTYVFFGIKYITQEGRNTVNLSSNVRYFSCCKLDFQGK